MDQVFEHDKFKEILEVLYTENTDHYDKFMELLDTLPLKHEVIYDLENIFILHSVSVASFVFNEVNAYRSIKDD